MKGKVVHISTVHHPLDTRIFYKQCTSLANAGYDVTLIIREHEDLKKVENINFKIITLPQVNNRLRRFISSSKQAYTEAKKLGADIYHFHDPELVFIGKLLKTKTNSVIYDIHEDYETSINQKKYISRPLRKIISKIYTTIEKSIIKDFQLCLAEKYYKEKYPDGLCILNYPLIDFNEVDKGNSKRKINKDSTTLIYTGNVTPDRGAFIHSKIPNFIDDVKVKFVGKCNRDVAEKIYTSNSKKQNIEIIGLDKYISRHEIDKEYKDPNLIAGLALFPISQHYAKKELTKFFEYMMVGLPIICSNYPSWKAFIEKHNCGISVNPENEEEIKEAVKYLKENPVKAQEMGENGRNAIKKALNWDAEKEKLVNLYENLIEKG